jgi:hypothetical protein
MMYDAHLPLGDGWGRLGPISYIKVGFAFFDFQGGFKENRPTVPNCPPVMVRMGSDASYTALHFCHTGSAELGSLSGQSVGQNGKKAANNAGYRGAP